MSRVDRTALGEIEAHARTRITLTIPSDVIDPDAPPVPLPMLDFRLRVVRGTAQERDRAWRHLGKLARAERGDWNLYALGVAYPKLRAQVVGLTAYRRREAAEQAHYDLAAEFLFALHRLDLDTPHVFPRLVDAAYTHASGRKKKHSPPMYDIDTLPEKYAPRSAHGNSEHDAELNEANQETVHDVLNRIIAAANSVPGRGRITDTQAELIRRTYLDGETLRVVATDLNLSEPSASKQRRRAAATIARLLRTRRADKPADPPKQRRPEASEPHPRRGPMTSISRAEGSPGRSAPRGSSAPTRSRYAAATTPPAPADHPQRSTKRDPPSRPHRPTPDR
ncbi:hypothetical protein O7630_03095 [Micromonospora sp. WMMD718]|uniref:hypothetical protein n=1 Tax=Micromonospora sp. WMMD718 TaxID=3016098 RepID=UPI0024164EAE|nr:hypothetical protein [Micromonospora sp. WMMD718]MDG4749919.1 hypothetical protein [Micromonospora sp. WMMD718]